MNIIEAEISLQAEQGNNNKRKYFKLALLLALILNLLVLLFLIFYSLDSGHINFFPLTQERSSGLPVYFDIGGSPQGTPAGVAQNLSVGQDSQTSKKIEGAPENLSVGYQGPSAQETAQSDNKNKQLQAQNSGAAIREIPFGFDDIDGEKDTQKFDKEKAMLKDLSQEKELAGLNQELEEQNLASEKEQNLEEKTKELKTDKMDLSLWHEEQQKINAKKNNLKSDKTQLDKVNEAIQEKSKGEVISQKRVLPKKSGSIFGKELLEGFKNYMQEQKYAQDSHIRSVSIGADDYNSTNNPNYNSYQTGGELGRSLTSQLKGEVNGMLLIKELALASRLDESMVQSEKFIDKIIPFELTIGEHGKVLNVELKESCGAPSVDKHFIKLVYQASPINHYARHYKGSPFKITLSIRFIVPAGANRLLVTYGGN